MAKTITLKDMRIREIVIQPNSDTAMGITYEVLGDDDKVLMVKNTTLKQEDFSTKGKKAIADFAADLLIKVKQAENFV